MGPVATLAPFRNHSGAPPKKIGAMPLTARKPTGKKWRKREIVRRATDRESSHTIQKRRDTRDAEHRDTPFETSEKPYGKQQFHVTCAKRLAATEARGRKRTPKREGRYPESPYDGSL